MLPDPPLRSIYVYLTRECNQRCPHCWIDPALEGRWQGRMPTLAQYRRLIDDAIPLGLDYVKLTGGEPLLRAEAAGVIEHAAARRIAVSIETNAMLVTPDYAALLSRHRVQTSVSVDAASPEIHDRRRGLPGAFERTWTALRLLIGARVPTTLVVAVSKSNLGEIPRILELMRAHKGRAPLNLKINPIVPMGRARRMEANGQILTPRELLDLAAWVSDHLAPEYKRHGIEILLQLDAPFFSLDSLARGGGRATTGHCGFLNLLSVLADGSISFCGIGYSQPQYTMGNICEDYDLAAIWTEHVTLTRTRWTLHHGLEGVCRECLFQPRCLGGCRALALAASGSVAAPAPWCQALYDAGLFPETRLKTPGAASVQSRRGPVPHASRDLARAEHS